MGPSGSITSGPGESGSGPGGTGGPGSGSGSARGSFGSGIQNSLCGPGTAEQMQNQRYHGEDQQQMDQSSGHMKCQPAETPHAQQDKKQYQKKKVSKHFRFPSMKMRNGEGCFGLRAPAQTGDAHAYRRQKIKRGRYGRLLRTKQEAPDLQAQIADESNTQAVLQLSSETSTHQPHRCSTRDQRHITENSPIKPEALGLVKRFWRISVGKVLDGKGAGLVYPPLARGVTPSDGSKFQPKITCSEGHTIRNLD